MCASQAAGLTAGHVKEGAVDGRDPEVGGARVEQHSELLRGGADANRPIVLGLVETSFELKSLNLIMNFI